jgi:hypothetical protein
MSSQDEVADDDGRLDDEFGRSALSRGRSRRYEVWFELDEVGVD